MTNILSDITSEVANLGKVYTNSEKLAEMISNLTNDICHELDINVRLVRQNINYFDSIPGFMCAYPKEIHYSLDKIKDMKKAIINGKTSDYDPQYNDITYSFYLMNSIYHEAWHCSQEQEIKKGNISVNNFFNAISLASQNNPNYLNIHYLERFHEGEAYSKGINYLFRQIEESTTISPFYSKVTNNQLKELTFFSKNIKFASAISSLCLIPFISNGNNFENVIPYISRGLQQMPNALRNNIFSNYPQLAIVYQENGLVKDPDKLMKQYFDCEVTHKNIKNKITEKEQDSLIGIYLYALVPQLNEETYDKLCNKYGHDKMHGFMNKMNIYIENQKQVFVSAANCAKKDVAFIKDRKLLQDIDETYVINKGMAGINYLYSCGNKIDECLSKKDVKEK